MLTDNIKKVYQYENWPENSKIASLKKAINNKADFHTEYRLIERYPMPYKNSYEDIYVKHDDADNRISLTVVNADSFTQAKEKLIEHLSECTAYGLPQLVDENNRGVYDIAYGSMDGKMTTLSMVRGNAFILIRSVGLNDADVETFFERFSAYINE